MSAREQRLGPEPTRRSSPEPMTPEPRKDDILVRVAQGDSNAISECLKRYGQLVWSVARKSWSDAATIEDVVQEIFIDVWKSADRYDPEKASEATFIATIARRRVIDRRRRAGAAPVKDLPDDIDIGADDKSLDQVDLCDEARLAREAMDELKPDQRRVILMSVVDGLTHAEIASATGMPLGTVKSHIRRGLEQTAQKLRAAKGESS